MTMVLTSSNDNIIDIWFNFQNRNQNQYQNQREQPCAVTKPAGWRNGPLRGESGWTFKYGKVKVIIIHHLKYCTGRLAYILQ